MFGLFNPWILLGALLVVIGTFFYGHHKGWNERDAEVQAEVAKANEQARTVERNLNEKVTQTAVKLQEAKNAITEKQSALDRAIRNGRVRFPTSGCVSAAPSPAPAAGDRNEAPRQPDRPADPVADAERETLAAIAAIVAEGDRNTAQLNACIDAYNTLREQMNAKR